MSDESKGGERDERDGTECYESVDRVDEAQGEDDRRAELRAKVREANRQSTRWPR
ncbi:hypothetical protein [Streptomyces purpurogeneiscleroticus]|uniref:hypothetical protein n=1 Tax=Streptomyces purpurogeneiscleroticus TaxID=68259 RepID=UPI001CBC6543|nr:hypothetical protein [Streptomyces purpurogeneiscleroticus]